MLAWLNIAALWRPKRDLKFLRSTDEFRAILQRERMRVDRNSHSFALLTLIPRGRVPAHDQLEFIETILAERLRATDIAGELEGERVAVLLPETTAEGAWKLADDICQLVPPECEAPTCDVYEYPTAPTSSSRMNGLSERANSQLQVAEGAFAELTTRATPLWKRSMDVVGATIGLILAAPLMLFAVVAIKLSSPGAVLFRQTRAGLGEKPFEMYKFRTMYRGAESLQAALRAQSEQDGPAFKMSHDPRITPVGRFLRRTSIDELPQLWNVLRGDMSLVGPRPLPRIEAGECRGWQSRRHDVAPGITCIWQVKGRSIVSFAEWARMDVTYVTTRSFACDVKLLLLTIPAVISCRGAR